MTQTPDAEALALCAEVEALDKAATAGPWQFRGTLVNWHFTQSRIVEAAGTAIACPAEPNGEFIAHARTSAPALAAHVRRLHSEVRRYETTTYCLYCGTGFALEDKEAAANAVDEHVRIGCQSHPIRLVKKRAEAAEAEVKRLREALRRFPIGHGAHFDATGGSGSGCPLCIEQRNYVDAALAPAQEEKS